MFTPATANQSPGSCPAHRFPGPPLTRRDPSGLTAGAALRPRGFPGESRAKPLRLRRGGGGNHWKEAERAKNPQWWQPEGQKLQVFRQRFKRSLSSTAALDIPAKTARSIIFLLRKVFENCLILFSLKGFSSSWQWADVRMRQEDHEFEISLDYTFKK